jgi:unsaturated rhamnogalacturonyl hydrolase
MKMNINMTRLLCLLLAIVSTMQFPAHAQQPWSQRMSATAMRIWPDSFLLAGDKTAKWRYDQGVILKGMEAVWNATGDRKWFSYIAKSMDHYVREDGSIRGYRPDEYNIDHVNNGKLLLTLWRVTGKDKYRKAADALRQQLVTHPRTSEGGFWHKNIYPWQMWLDGLYMGQPFYAEYAGLFHQDTVFNDVVRQFELMERHSSDPRSGLLYHGWDEKRAQRWADPATGRSPHVWGRSLGWFGMALVDVLDHIPENHPQRSRITEMLKRFAAATAKVQDPASGTWYDIPDMPTRAGNYPEASASCMLAYTYAKGVRLGVLPATYAGLAKKAWTGILKTFITEHPNGDVDLKGTVSVSGLGGNPYRDGSYAYYMSEPVIVNDPKGMGAFILCATELEILLGDRPGQGKRVLIDRYFNNERKKDPLGHEVRWHYTWNDRTNGGYAMLGEIFRRHGATIGNLDAAPTDAGLKGASVYIIVDADTEKETPKPNFMDAASVDAIERWVKAGGVLVMLGNDSGNAEFDRFNMLANRFGIGFIKDSRNRVQGDKFEQGIVSVPDGHEIFKKSRTLYIKEYSPLTVKAPARSVLDHEGYHVMAVAKVGKGTVYALGDPWIYNEYVDGRKLPSNFENYPAADGWVRWLLQNAGK